MPHCNEMSSSLELGIIFWSVGLCCIEKRLSSKEYYCVKPSEPHTSMNSSCMCVKTNHLLEHFKPADFTCMHNSNFSYVVVYATVVSHRNCKIQWITGHRHMIVKPQHSRQLWMTTVQAFTCCADGSSEGKCPKQCAWHRWTFNLLGYYPLHSAHTCLFKPPILSWVKACPLGTNSVN